jgi:hypothetical protein
MKLTKMIRRHALWLAATWVVALYVAISSGCMGEPPQGSPTTAADEQDLSTATCPVCPVSTDPRADEARAALPLVCAQSCVNCGNGVCDPGETHAICPTDCPTGGGGGGGGTSCGDHVCNGSETPTSCPRDCTNYCGNGRCDPGEGNTTCPEDCCAHANPPCAV